MADPNHPDQRGQKPFAEFLREAPRHGGGTVSLTGHVAQSEKEGHFVLDLGGGQTVELPTEAVRSYKVAQEGGRQVQLELDRKSIEHLKSIFADGHGQKLPTQDIHTVWFGDKAAHKDPIFEPLYPQFPSGPDPTQLGQLAQAAGAVPFTLAAAHQAPQSSLTLQGLSGQVKPIYADRTVAYYDVHHTFKEIVKDPIFETVKEIYETLVEGGGTIQEGGGTIQEGGGFPGGGFNPGY